MLKASISLQIVSIILQNKLMGLINTNYNVEISTIFVIGKKTHIGNGFEPNSLLKFVKLCSSNDTL